MPLEQQEAVQELHHCFQKEYENLSGVDSLSSLRKKAWEQFLQMGFPSDQVESYRYIKKKELFTKELSSAHGGGVAREAIAGEILPECSQSVIVLVNGIYSPELSDLSALPEKVEVRTTVEAMRSYGSFMKHRWAKTLKEEADPFVVANTALSREGAFIYVPPKVQVERPIQILHVIDGGEASLLMHPRVQGFLGAQSELTCFSTAVTLSGEGYVVNQVHDWTLDESAHLKYSSACFEESEKGWRLDAFRAQLKRQAVVSTVALTPGMRTHRQDWKVVLQGERAEASLKGLWLLQKGREVHHHVLIDHQAPHCPSMQLFKGVLTDHAKSSFEGKIYVHKEAQLTDAFQLNRNLLLSPGAQAYSKPNLEIFADDVKASHGATVGQLSEEELFYLQARGVNKAAAQRMLVRAFCEEILESCASPTLKAWVVERMGAPLICEG